MSTAVPDATSATRNTQQGYQMNKVNEETEKKKRPNWVLRHMFSGLPHQSRGEDSMLPACCSQKQTTEKETRLTTTLLLEINSQTRLQIHMEASKALVKRVRDWK